MELTRDSVEFHAATPSAAGARADTTGEVAR
jgi:hypothetical protein